MHLGHYDLIPPGRKEQSYYQMSSLSTGSAIPRLIIPSICPLGKFQQGQEYIHIAFLLSFHLTSKNLLSTYHVLDTLLGS